MNQKDTMDHIQDCVILTLFVSVTVLMLSASYLCLTYQAHNYPDTYQVNLYSHCANTEMD